MSNSITVASQELDLVELSTGQTLFQLSSHTPVMLVFLRHLGCVFCREALEDISKCKDKLDEAGVTVVFVHMEAYEMGEEYLQKHNLSDALHYSDPNCDLYRSFGLVKATLGQLMGFQTLIKGFAKGIELSQFGGKAFGDAFQMPGVFILSDGKVVDTFMHKRVWDRPDYLQLVISSIKK